MSELFDWLKKTEFDKKRKGDAPVPEPPEIKVPVLESTVTTEVIKAPPDVRAGAEFNLELTDWRVRAVLDPKTVVGEQFRFLRAKLATLKSRRPLKKLLVTSSVPAEGKTFTSCCLAGILAQEPGKRVLLVDADLRRPSAHEQLGIGKHPDSVGLSELLQGTAEFKDTLLSCSNMAFFFLPAGSEPDNPSELLSSPRLEGILEQLAASFDWVVIDCPPVLALADAIRLAPLCDGVIMVLQANRTPAKLVRQSIEMVGRDRICGVVLNRVRDFHSSHYYYRHYKYKNYGHKK